MITEKQLLKEIESLKAKVHFSDISPACKRQLLDGIKIAQCRFIVERDIETGQRSTTLNPYRESGPALEVLEGGRAHE